MIEAYKNVLIKNDPDGSLFIFKDFQPIGAIFGIDTVNPQYLNLVAAAPIMYTNMDHMATMLTRLSLQLEPIIEMMGSQQEKQLITNIVGALAAFRQTCLDNLHVAEVGPTKAYSDKNKS